MKIGLIDVDGHNFPNLALMKIAGWHKQQGDMTEWAFAFNEYDRIYKSKVFTFTPDDMTAYQCPDIRNGGTGYDIKSRLPDEVSWQKVDPTAAAAASGEEDITEGGAGQGGNQGGGTTGGELEG